jgi:hypothetical protein
MDVLTYDMLIIFSKISDSMYETWIIYHVYVYHTLTPNVAIIRTEENRALILLPVLCTTTDAINFGHPTNGDTMLLATYCRSGNFWHTTLYPKVCVRLRP